MNPIYLTFTLLPIFVGISIQDSKEKIKAWIEIKDEVANLSITANLLNTDEQISNVDYFLTTEKKGLSGSTSTSQSGKCISIKNKNITLSESRLNLSRNDVLTVRLKVYHNKMVVAQDSVVFHGDND
jgi:hypothetical protein